MRSIARNHPLATFLAIAYAASAAIFAIPFLSNAGIGVIGLDLPGVAPFVLVDAFALAGVPSSPPPWRRAGAASVTCVAASSTSGST